MVIERYKSIEISTHSQLIINICNNYFIQNDKPADIASTNNKSHNF